MLLTNHPAHPNPPTGSANQYATPDRRGSRTCAPSSAPSPVRVHEIRVHSTVLQPLEAIAHTTWHAWMIRDTNPRHPRATPSGHWPHCLYRSSVAAFAGSHHARFRVYHSIVCARPDRNPYASASNPARCAAWTNRSRTDGHGPDDPSPNRTHPPPAPSSSKSCEAR